MRIEVWSDVVCPFCYIGKRHLEAALEKFPHRDEVEVVWRSFQLDPTVPEGETFASLPALAEKFGQPVEQVRAMQSRVADMAASAGLEYHLEDSLGGNTLRAHELIHFAAARGRGPEMKERLLRAHFTENRSVFDVDSLVALAAEVGLDSGDARAALDDRRYLPAVREDITTAQAYGATGVPFFVIDRKYGVSGAQPVEVFSQVLEKAHADAG
jgi:predicted DsbA family dithiol-disulfide isomerase